MMKNVLDREAKYKSPDGPDLASASSLTESGNGQEDSHFNSGDPDVARYSENPYVEIEDQQDFLESRTFINSGDPESLNFV